MNHEALILRSFIETPEITQRELASSLDISLGNVNRKLTSLMAAGYLEQEEKTSPNQKSRYHITQAGLSYMEQFKVDGAVITAAGFGSRFVPLTFETPKGLLEVFGERMIERQIKQLHAAGVTDITILVGYLKEKFEYLIDKYGVKLLYNPEYHCKNTLGTFYHAKELFRNRNMYLLVSDNWLRESPYHAYECDAWYSATYMEGETSEWCLDYNKKDQITAVHVGGHDSYAMYGPAFLSREFNNIFVPMIEKAYATPGTEQWYWENVVMSHISELPLFINKQPDDQIYEFENLEELRLFDPKYRNHSDSAAMELVAEVFGVKESVIRNIRCLKAGMTNQSFLFEVEGKHYICRIPGVGTDKLINRAEEKASYDAVESLNLTEHVIYFNGETGYKISEYYEGARNAIFTFDENLNPSSDIAICMQVAKTLHESGLTVSHEFDLKEKIDFYQSLCRGRERMLFEDYEEVYNHQQELLSILETMDLPKVLSHLDTVCDNFLFLPDGTVKLIDWEYAAMHDPLVDVSMCGIYSYFTPEQIQKLLDIYLGREATTEERFRVYAYASLGGFLWALWAVFKSMEGKEFGDYTIVMYRYGKTCYRKAMELKKGN